ncbi:MAG: sulfatase-like hydrolase/transferase [Planctomycetes bacterium]|nr:sulfatase-like hydrolase/transferase [Planctomycetota bacterium]MCC7172941.1 sulfatase-like hydrolase/transferase [Planctomycetota bacterium]
MSDGGADGRRWASAGLRFMGLALVGAGFWGCGDSSPQRPVSGPLDVLLVTLDTTRFDRTAVGGAPRERTPRLAALAESGRSYTRAYAPVPVTLPSHTTLLSGLLPTGHGLTQNGTRRVPDEMPLLQERFAARGYATAAFVSATVLDARYGLARGFATYRAPAPGQAERPGRETAALAVEYVRTLAADRPAFVWVHFYDAHAPYAPPPGIDAPTPYDGEIRAADDALGVVLDAFRAAGRLERTIVCVTADHGEGLGDHGEDEHGMFVYEEAIHVPFVLARSGAAWSVGSRDDRLASLADVAPTLSSLCGLEPIPGTHGLDLLGDARHAAVYAETHVPRESHGFAPLFAHVESRWKYIDAPEAELFDLDADPREARNAIQDSPAEAARMHADLERVRAGAPSHANGPRVDLAPDDVRLLEELGYLGGGSARASGLDPKIGIHLHNMLREASKRLARGDAAGAFDLAERARKTDPGSRAAAHIGARAAVARRDPATAEQWLTQHLRSDPDDAEGWLELGILRGAQSPRAAAECFERALRANPSSFEAAFNLGLAQEQAGDGALSRAAYERALSFDSDGRAHNALAWSLATSDPSGSGPRALELARVAVARQPANANFQDTLAEACAACGDLTGAVAAAREAVRVSQGQRPDLVERMRHFEQRLEQH